jgi:hypothetical protein
VPTLTQQVSSRSTGGLEKKAMSCFAGSSEGRTLIVDA